jgi:hypothetical protein
VAPTTAPTQTTTEVPTNIETTPEPSSAPIETDAPTDKKTFEPTSLATDPPTKPGSISETLTGLRMGLAGLTDLPATSQRNWEDLTKSFSESYAYSDLSTEVENFVTTYQVTSVTPASTRKLQLRGVFSGRNLQQAAVIIEYTQTMQYDTSSSVITPEILAQAPFETSDGKTSYVTLLRNSEDTVLDRVIGVSNVLVSPVTPTSPPVMAPTSAPAQAEDSPILSLAAIIGIACGGGALLIIIVLYCLYCRGGGGGGGDYGKGNDDHPLHVSVRDDEVSTLAGPTGPPTYGDQRYVCALDVSGDILVGARLRRRNANIPVVFLFIFLIRPQQTTTVWRQWITITQKPMVELEILLYRPPVVLLDPTHTINLLWILRLPWQQEQHLVPCTMTATPLILVSEILKPL